MTASTPSVNGTPPARARAEPPTPELPYWRASDGQRNGFSEVIAGRDPDQVAELSGLHVQAIAALLRAGFAARASGEHADERRLFASAARLCTEPLGHWPAAGTRSDH